MLAIVSMSQPVLDEETYFLCSDRCAPHVLAGAKAAPNAPASDDDDPDSPSPREAEQGDDEVKPSPGPGQPMVPQPATPDANPIDPRVFLAPTRTRL